MPKVMPKIVVRLMGGLGNQLFQFQKMINIIESTGETDVAFDISFYKRTKKAHEKVAFGKLFNGFRIIDLDDYNWRSSRFLARALWKFNLKPPELGRVRFVFHDQRNWENVRKSKYIVDGFWQDSKEINESAVNKIRVALKKECESNNIHYLNSIRSSESVCVHIRRGDYLTNRYWFLRQQDVLPVNYYQKAFDKFEEELDNPSFFVFSDDMEWVKKNFKGNESHVFVEDSDAGSLETLYLMSMCKHFIIANSAFSWWASGLSENINKKTIAPDPWQKRHHSNGILLPGWELIQW
jgi:hypothetical protein